MRNIEITPETKFIKPPACHASSIAICVYPFEKHAQIDGLAVQDDEEINVDVCSEWTQLVTLWIDSASRLTFPVVMPATEIRPSLVAYTEC